MIEKKIQRTTAKSNYNEKEIKKLREQLKTWETVSNYCDDKIVKDALPQMFQNCVKLAEELLDMCLHESQIVDQLLKEREELETFMKECGIIVSDTPLQ